MATYWRLKFKKIFKDNNEDNKMIKNKDKK
jgi:hypothetical protein